MFCTIENVSGTLNLSEGKDFYEVRNSRMTDPPHSAESAAELLGVRPSTILWWWTIGKLRRVKIGRLTRVRESELLALIEPSHPNNIVPKDVGER